MVLNGKPDKTYRFRLKSDYLVIPNNMLKCTCQLNYPFIHSYMHSITVWSIHTLQYVHIIIIVYLLVRLERFTWRIYNIIIAAIHCLPWFVCGMFGEIRSFLSINYFVSMQIIDTGMRPKYSNNFLIFTLKKKLFVRINTEHKYIRHFKLLVLVVVVWCREPIQNYNSDISRL